MYLWIHKCPYFCTQDTLPTVPEGSPPTPVATVSQYACQRRTTTENNNKIFTVRNLSNLTLDTTELLHVRPPQPVALTLQCKKPPNLFCSNWTAGLLHSPALWHNSPQNTLTCKWAASAAVARWRCNSWHAHDPWHGGLARTRPEAQCATPRWAPDVTLLTSNDGSVPLPSGGQCGREGLGLWWAPRKLRFPHRMGKWFIGWLV